MQCRVCNAGYVMQGRERDPTPVLWRGRSKGTLKMSTQNEHSSLRKELIRGMLLQIMRSLIAGVESEVKNRRMDNIGA